MQVTSSVLFLEEFKMESELPCLVYAFLAFGDPGLLPRFILLQLSDPQSYQIHSCLRANPWNALASTSILQLKCASSGFL